VVPVALVGEDWQRAEVVSRRVSNAPNDRVEAEGPQLYR
jgi:hypothetical protein